MSELSQKEEKQAYKFDNLHHLTQEPQIVSLHDHGASNNDDFQKEVQSAP